MNVDEIKAKLANEGQLDTDAVSKLETAKMLRESALCAATVDQLTSVNVGLALGDALAVKELFPSPIAAAPVDAPSPTTIGNSEQLAAAINSVGNAVQAIADLKAKVPADEWSLNDLLTALAAGNQDPDVLDAVTAKLGDRHFLAMKSGKLDVPFSFKVYNKRKRATDKDPKTIDSYVMLTLTEFLAETSWSNPADPAKKVEFGSRWYSIREQYPDRFEAAHYLFAFMDDYRDSEAAIANQCEGENPGAGIAKAMELMGSDPRWQQEKDARMKWQGGNAASAATFRSETDDLLGRTRW